MTAKSSRPRCTRSLSGTIVTTSNYANPVPGGLCSGLTPDPNCALYEAAFLKESKWI